MLRSQVDLKKNQDLNYIYFSKGTEIYGTARISLDVSLSFCHQSFPLQHKGRNDWLAEERQRSSKEILPGQVLYSLQRWPGLVSRFLSVVLNLFLFLIAAEDITARKRLAMKKKLSTTRNREWPALKTTSNGKELLLHQRHSSSN